METGLDMRARRSTPDARFRLVVGGGPVTSTTMTVAKSAFKIEDLDYHFIRASDGHSVPVFWLREMVQIRCAGAGSHGPLIFWLYPVLGPQGATWFLGVTEWTIGSLLLLGFWDKRLGALGAAGGPGDIHRHGHHHSVLP